LIIVAEVLAKDCILICQGTTYNYSRNLQVVVVVAVVTNGCTVIYYGTQDNYLRNLPEDVVVAVVTMIVFIFFKTNNISTTETYL
jgi:uncharacterized BrkB/YihY/UPF0761 family membrane protein